jgi:hypothetical protein
MILEWLYIFSVYFKAFELFDSITGKDFISAIYTQSVTISAHKMKPDWFFIGMSRVPE